jgi:hypothetical protein
VLVTSVRGVSGWANRLSAGFTARCGFGCEQLVGALVGDPEDGGGVAHGDPAAGQSGGFAHPGERLVDGRAGRDGVGVCAAPAVD